MAKKRKGRRSRWAKAKRRAAANELWAADGAAPAAAAAAAAPAAAAPARPPAAAPAPAPAVVQGETARAQRRRRRSEKAHPRGGANGKRAKVVRDAGADAVALWDVACTMEDMCRLVDAMDAYIDSDGSQEYACDACAGQARACAACGVRGIQHLEREVQEAHATLGTRAAADAAANHEHFPFRCPALCAALAAAPVTDIPCPCVCCTGGAGAAGVSTVGCRTAECCRRHQTAAARVAALTKDPRDEDIADAEADALAGAAPAGAAAAAAASGVRPLPYFGGSPRGSPVGSDGSRGWSPEPFGMLGLCKRD